MVSDVIAEVFALLQEPKPQDSSRKRKGQDAEEQLDWGDLGLDANNLIPSHGLEDSTDWQGWTSFAWEEFGVYLAGVDDGRPF